MTRGNGSDAARLRAERKAARSLRRSMAGKRATDGRTDDPAAGHPGRGDAAGMRQDRPAGTRRLSGGTAPRDPVPLTHAPDVPADSRARQGDLTRTAHLFEHMIAMVEPRGGPAAAVLAEPLSSLLRQCQEISASVIPDSLPLLVALPGMPMLQPDWWQGTAGWGVLRLPDARGDIPDAATLAAMRRARAREGRRLLAVMPADAVPDDLPGPLRPVALLTCHPWTAFLAGGNGATSLDAFSARVLAFLDRHPDLPLYPVDPAGRDSCRTALLRLAEGGAGPDPTSSPADRDAGQPNDYLGGAPAYDTLCRRLGCDPARAPEPPGTGQEPSPGTGATGTVLPASGSPAATVSWFLDRLAALPDGPDLAARMRALIPALDACLAAPAFPEALDRAAGRLRPADAALLRLLAAAHVQRHDDALQSMGLVAEALESAPPGLPALRQGGALLYLELNRPLQALEALAAPLAAPGVLTPSATSALRKAIHGDTPPDAGQHGQALLVAALAAEPPLPAPDGRQRIMVEIGTTRETVPGQGSTRQLALLCAELGIDFVTVDMDPANSRRAARMFRRLGLPFSAVTAKGEDYLAAFEGTIDYVFLDAYDFDHGKHSELRQARYEQFLGTRINDADCHRMHLDCARTLADKLAPDGLICFDDTWTDDAGAWTAKGKTAMPFLLDNSFAVAEARNNAALLRRKD